MWFFLALLSALLLGCYDVFKKKSLHNNAVVPVLFFNTLFSTLIFLPLIILSAFGNLNQDFMWYVPYGDAAMHLSVLGKAVIVLSSWICGYIAIKHLPLTIVGPVNATRPVITLAGAILLFGEHLNLWQWAGVIISIVAFFLMSQSGKREGIDFKHNRYVLLLVTAAFLGACSGLYDKHLLAPQVAGGKGIAPSFVQCWFNVYQVCIMAIISLYWYVRNSKKEPFQWRWTILFISLFLCAADMCYFYALSHQNALIAIVSMTRRSSVLVSFLFGVFLLKERNVKSKAVDLLLVFVSLILLCIGTLVR